LDPSLNVRTRQSSLQGEQTQGGRQDFPSLLILIGAGFLLLILGSGPPPALALSFNGLWEHTVSGGDELDTTNLFTQVYRVSEGIGFEPTDAIAGTASISYNRTQGTSKPQREIWSPGGTLELANDLFRLGLSGTITQDRRENSSDLDTTRWRASLAPAWYPWRQDLWPGMSFYYGESQVTSPDWIDSHETDYGGGLHLKLPDDVIFNYNYDLRREEDRRTQRTVETGTHFGQVRTSGALWHDRFTIKFTQGITHEHVTDSGIVPATGVVEQVPQVSFVYYSVVDENDPGFVPHDFALSEHENSMLGNLENTDMLGIGPGQSWHLGVSPIFAPNGEQQVDQLRVYVNDPTQELSQNQGVLHWDLYAGFDNTQWEPVAADVKATFNSIDQRFEVDLPALAQDYLFLMVVVSNHSIPGAGEVTVNVRAVQSIPLSTATPGSSFSNSSSQTRHSSNADIRMMISPTLTASSNIIYRYGEGYYSGTAHANLNWSPSPLTQPSLAFTESRRDSDATAEVITRTASISVPLSLLPTFQVNLGATRNGRFSDGQRQFIQDSYVLTLAATLYPDLTATFTELYRTGETIRSNGTINKLENFTSNLDLKARLTPKLTCDLANSLTETYEPRQDTQFFSDLRIYYRLSDLVSLDLHLQKYWTGLGDSLEATLRLALLRTRKTRLNFNSRYRHVENMEAEKFFGLQGSWDISRLFTLKSTASYSVTDINAWNVRTALYMQF
jgi:hypothetical protein